MIGPLSRDLVDDAAERIGGPPWYAARALRAMQQEAMVVAKCGEPERRSYLRLYEDHLKKHPDSPPEMVFRQ